MKRKTFLKDCPNCGDKVRPGRYEIHISQRCLKRPRPYPFIEAVPIPHWLSEIVEAARLPEKFPFRKIIENSCYYPASGLDASPVIIANGYVHSFVYCDYGISEVYFQRELTEVGFKGYQKILQRPVFKDEIVPDDWIPELPTDFDQFNGDQRLKTAQKQCVPFGDWSIWRRCESLDDFTGPEYFSFFFMAGEGLAIYQGLYLRNKITPTVLAIIQPGHAFGGNWTNFTKQSAPFWQIVLKQQTPKYLLIGGYENNIREEIECPFDNYQFLSTTTTSELERTEYTFNENGDKTRNHFVALMASIGNSFSIRKNKIPRVQHTIHIFEKMN